MPGDAWDRLMRDVGRFNNPDEEPEEPEEEELGPVLMLLRAEPHQWGSGKVHEINEDTDLTFCGQSPARCPGKKFSGFANEITCKGCLISRDSRVRHAEWQAQYEKQRQAREELNRYWWNDYDLYLESAHWQEARRLVMRRCGGQCEGCGIRPARQVHHKRYPQNCRPGSPEWCRQQMLFDLVALCHECHERIHGKK